MANFETLPEDTLTYNFVNFPNEPIDLRALTEVRKMKIQSKEFEISGTVLLPSNLKELTVNAMRDIDFGDAPLCRLEKLKIWYCINQSPYYTILNSPICSELQHLVVLNPVLLEPRLMKMVIPSIKSIEIWIDDTEVMEEKEYAEWVKEWISTFQKVAPNAKIQTIS